MNRNRYRVLAALSVLTVTTGAIFGCGAAKDEPLNANITAVEDAAEAEDAEAAEEIPATPVLKETDFLGFILGGNDTQYLHMTLDELNEVTGGVYTEENAKEFDMDYDYAMFSFGELTGLFCDRTEFCGKLPVDCKLGFKDDKIVNITYYIYPGNETIDSASISDILAEYLAEKLPEDYHGEYDRQPEGKNSAVFANTVDGFVFTIKHMDIDGSGYPVLLKFETYKDKYGME